MGRQRAIRFRGKMPAGRAWLLSSVACAALALGTPQAPAAEPFAAPERFVAPEVPKWHPWAEIGGYWGSDRTSRGEATLWAPLFQRPDSLLFVDVRGKLFERSVREGNLALGWRQMTAAGWNWGIWTGVDAHRSRAGNTFWQWSGGLEALAPDWDARVNAYLPFDRRKPVSRTEVVVGNGEPEVVLANDQILMVSGEDRITTIIDELALHGFDAEAGVRLFGTDPDAPGPRHEFRLYGGGFWFDHRDLPRSLAGPMARAEWRIDDALGLSGSRLTLEAGFSYDRVRKDRWEAGARLRIPLGGARPEPAVAGLPLTPQERRMAERVERQTAVLTREVVEETVALERVEEQVADALTNVRFDRVATVEDGGSVTDTSAEAGANSLIIAEGGTISGPQQLQGDQTLQGGGSTIDVRGVETGTVMPFTAPGDQPTLADPGDAPNLTLLGSNTHVAGIAIEGAGPGNGANDGVFVGSDRRNTFIGLSSIENVGHRGIFINAGNELTIYQTGITDTGDRGIRINDDNEVNITDTNVTRAGHDSIDLEGSNNTVNILRATVRDGADDGIQVEGESNIVTIADTTISNVDDHGIQIGDEGGHRVDISRTTIRDVTRDGINIEDDNAITITDTTIQGTGNDGIAMGSGNIVGISNTTLQDIGRNAIRMESDNEVTINPSEIVNTGDDAIKIRGNFNTLEITDSEIRDAGNDAIDIDGSDNTVTLTRTSIINPDDNAIDSDNERNVITLNQSLLSNTGSSAINLRDAAFNTLTLEGTTIENVRQFEGITFEGNNTLIINNSTFAGDIDRDGFRSFDTTSTLSGDGNTAAGATFGGLFCNVPPQDDGSFVTFDIGNCPPQVFVSDMRLKRDIAKLATLDSGLHLYRYRYLWSDTVHVGVMAQEVQAVAPQAVVRRPDGFLQVDYSRLGLRPMTWDEWAARSRTDQASERPRLPAS